MFVSILIPVANGAEYLFAAIESVLAQTHTDWECHIVLNGEGLAGPAEAVANAFGDPRILVHSTAANNKVDALNWAVKKAKGEWIALLDADDMWHSTKLTEQIQALKGTAKGALVIGTAAHYFGQFQGSPQIPTGWISPTVFSSENPIINSSALIHISVCHWEYPPTHPDSLEDYYLWMRIAASQGRLYNLHRDLVAHRIHPSSAFNARHISPASLQSLWRSGTISPLPTPSIPPLSTIVSPRNTSAKERTVSGPIGRENKLRILTTVCNQPDYVRAQAKALRCWVGVEYEFIVFNDAKDWPDVTNFGDATMRKQIEEVCRELGIRCIPVENGHHRYASSASQRHCDTLRGVMEYVRATGPGRYWMIDSDMWPIAPYDVHRLEERFRGGGGTFVRQERNGIVYAWPNLWWLSVERREDLEGLSWDLAPACDTGGASATWMAAHTVQWLQPHRGSCAWGSANLTEGLLELRVFLEADPRNKNGMYWSEVYDDRLFHLRAGSNWNGEGQHVHERLVELVKSFFA